VILKSCRETNKFDSSQIYSNAPKSFFGLWWGERFSVMLFDGLDVLVTYRVTWVFY